ncbi:MAG: hypothetical protein J5708_04785 [Bacteroidales bacterium]|nr:hypothetical protein [Bacteroidales bacterium]
MKKLSIILVVVSMILTMTQCKKNVQDIVATDAGTIFISLDVNKGNRIDVNTANGVVTFKRYDQLHIVSEGKYCGFVTKETDNGSFTGTITEPVVGKPMYIYFLGVHNKNYSTIATGATSCNVDITDQTNNLPVISCGMTDVYSSGITSYEVMLLNKCALVKFNVTTSADNEATCLTGLKNEMIIDFTTNTFTPDTVKDAVIKLAKGSGERWAILLPNAAESAVKTAYSADYRYVGTRSALGEIHNNDYITTGYTVTVGTATTANPTYDDGKFSLSADKRVTFAKGNVQHVYDETKGQWIWKFAEHQYDVLHNENAQKYEGACDRDRFGWGTGDKPDLMSHSNSDYPQSTDDYAEWGKHFTDYSWFAPKCFEWKYLMFQRPASKLNDVYNARYARARVNGVNGIIVFPDVYNHPSTVALPTKASINYTTNNDGSFSINNYTEADWNAMEAAGAVFLPVTGCRDYKSGAWGFDATAEEGHYWSQCDLGDPDHACNMYFSDYRVYVKDKNDKYKGYSVRLVHE